MSLKRRRDEDGGVPDIPQLGGQVLPVANYLPEDFDGDPGDGMEYLFMVRRNTRSLPAFTRVHNPYATPPPPPSVLPKPRPRHPSLPNEEWIRLFERRFSDFRKKVKLATPTKEDIERIKMVKIPGAKDKAGWWAFINGPRNSTPLKAPTPTAFTPEEQPNKDFKSLDYGDEAEETAPPSVAPVIQMTGFLDGTPYEVYGDDEEGYYSAPTPDISSAEEGEALPTESKPVDIISEDMDAKPTSREPTLALVRTFDQARLYHVALFFKQWLGDFIETTAPENLALSSLHARWVFVVLAFLDDTTMTSDHIHTLRNLARHCITIASHSREKPGAYDLGSIGCWMIVAAVSGVWGQRDLWEDAENTLYRVRPS